MAASSSTERRVTLGAHGVVTFLEAGQGEPIVLLHGVGSAARSWRAQLDALSDAYRVVAWNAPGYGASSPIDAPAPDADDYAARLAAFLDALDIPSCHLVGHSLGALMAGRFARRHPARVRTLTLASCALGHARLDEAERRRLLESRIGDVDALGPRGMAAKRGPRLLGPDASPDHIESVVETMGMVDPWGYAQAARLLSGGDLLSDLSALDAGMRVSIVYGDADVITPAAANERAAAARAGAHTHVVPRAGHALYVEKAAAFNAILRAIVGERHEN